MSPYFDATRRHGCKAYTVYNHMYMPLFYDSPEGDYWRLVNDVTVWDVAGERQVEITGADAFRFVKLLTPRNLDKCEVGQCKYLVLTAGDGGILNDPVLLRLGENHFWLSLSDSDVLLWAKGVALEAGLDVVIDEPDVSPLQIQGPKSTELMKALFGGWVESLRYFRFREFEHEGVPLVVSRTGWSGERGYEIFLRDGSFGDRLFDRIMSEGKPFGVAPAGPSAIRRIEAAMLSYGADMTIKDNPFEVGLSWLVDLDQETSFIGKEALAEIKAKGVDSTLTGVFINGEPLNSNERAWPAFGDRGQPVGRITSYVWSPRLEKNIGLARLDKNHGAPGTRLMLRADWGERKGEVTTIPFIDPNKQLTRG